MAYKLMAVDIDGTLLNSQGVLTEATKQAIKAAVKKGLIFTISTGRPIQGVEWLNRELDLDLPYITYNGAMVVMGRSRKILYEQNLAPEDASRIIELGRDYGTTVVLWANNQLYAERITDQVLEYKEISKVEPELIKDMEGLIESGITKILWIDDVDKIERYRLEVKKHLSDRVNFHPSRPYFLEFVDKNASKAIAMEKLGEYFDISQSEMIAIGDGYNDLSMIEYAGLGVVMANANDEIKEKADFITLSNDEDGVAHVINTFILNEGR